MTRVSSCEELFLCCEVNGSQIGIVHLGYCQSGGHGPRKQQFISCIFDRSERLDQRLLKSLVSVPGFLRVGGDCGSFKR